MGGLEPETSHFWKWIFHSLISFFTFSIHSLISYFPLLVPTFSPQYRWSKFMKNVTIVLCQLPRHSICQRGTRRHDNNQANFINCSKGGNLVQWTLSLSFLLTVSTNDVSYLLLCPSMSISTQSYPLVEKVKLQNSHVQVIIYWLLSIATNWK